MQWLFGDYHGNRAVSHPSAIYKVYPDGREELIRGMDINDLRLEDFKDAEAGNRDYVYNIYPFQTIAVPSVLFDDVDLRKEEGTFPTPPIVPPPARGKR